MMNPCHLVWIIPLSAGTGVLFTAFMVGAKKHRGDSIPNKYGTTGE